MKLYLDRLMIISFILFVLLLPFLVGCKKIKEAPVTHLYVIDIQNSVCSKREITDKKSLSSRWIEDMPLESCDGNVSLTMQEFLNLRTFLKNQK